MIQLSWGLHTVYTGLRPGAAVKFDVLFSRGSDFKPGTLVSVSYPRVLYNNNDCRDAG